MVSEELKLSFQIEDDDEIAEISTLFGGCGNPLGEVRLADTRCLITKHYVQFANDVRNLKIRSDDVWVVSFPRSGTY